MKRMASMCHVAMLMQVNVMHSQLARACQISTADSRAAEPAQPPPAPETVRLFVALLPSAEVLAALAQHADQWRWGLKATRYAPQDCHVTLHFIGSVPCDRLDEVRAGLAVPVTPFDLQFGQAALWPHGLAVLCPEAVPEGLQQLHGRLGQALQRLGMKTDTRPLRPHITLARRAQDAVLPLQRPLFSWPVAGYALMASTAKAPQRYRMVQHYGSAACTGASGRVGRSGKIDP